MADEITPITAGRKARRFTIPKTTKTDLTDHVNFRADTKTIRAIDEMVASRFDPELKTRSDVLNDAIFAWVQNNMPAFLQVTGGRDKEHFGMYARKWIREQRDAELQTMQEEIHIAEAARNISALRKHFIEAYQFLNELNADEDAHPPQIEETQKIITRLKKVLHD